MGFGISGPEQARKAAKVSDGVIVGSAIVKLIADHPDAGERVQKVGQFVAGVKQAVSDLT